MIRSRSIGCGCILGLGFLVLLAGCGDGNLNTPGDGGPTGWRDTFDVDKFALADTGRNPYFILDPGYRLTYADGEDTLTIAVLDVTAIVDGVTTRVVEERETKDGQLAEVSRNYFAIDPATGDVYYFGEAVDMYRSGQVTGHGGSWLSGSNGARFGLAMPGKPAIGQMYYQEYAPGAAMDRAEIVSLTDELSTPAGAFKNVLRVRESSALDPGAEDKWYAAGVGLLKDEDFVLVKVEARP